MMKPLALSLFALSLGAAVFAVALFAGAFHVKQTATVQYALASVEQADSSPVHPDHHGDQRRVSARAAFLTPAVLKVLKSTLGEVAFSIGFGWLQDFTGDFFGLLSNDDKQWKEINQKLDEINNKLVDVQEKLNSLQAGIYDLKFAVVIQNMQYYGNQIKSKWEILKHNLETKNWKAQVDIYDQEDPYLKETWEAAFGIYSMLSALDSNNPFQVLFTSDVYKGLPILEVYHDVKAFALQWTTTLSNAAILLNAAASYRKQNTYKEMAQKIMEEYIPKLEQILESSTSTSSPPILPPAFSAACRKILTETLAQGESPQMVLGTFKIRNHLGNLVHSGCNEGWVNNDDWIMDSPDARTLSSKRYGCRKASYGKECIRQGRMASFGDNLQEQDVHLIKDTSGDGSYLFNVIQWDNQQCSLVRRAGARLSYYPYNRAGTNHPWSSVNKNILYGSRENSQDLQGSSRMQILWDRTEGNKMWFNFVSADHKTALGWDEPMKSAGDEEVESTIAVFDELPKTFDFYGRSRNMFQLVTEW